MKSFCYCAILFLLLVNCRKSKVETSDVLKNYSISSRSVVADGSSTITLIVELGNNSDADKRNVLFTASSGSFIGGKDSTVSIKAIFIDNVLTAKAYFVAPLQPGKINLSIQPDLNTYSNIRITDVIEATKSVPEKIKLNVNSFAVRYGFLSEDTLTVKLSNDSGGKVSTGAKIMFDDTFLDNSAVHGRFRQTSATSNSSSQASSIYSPGFQVQVGMSVWVKAYLADNPAVRDSFMINVIQ
jgi:hypothetical protein